MLGSALAAGVLYWLVRQMERWLQQHIFKVGWLLTKDFRTTTVLYYVFFLPGVILHEVALWLTASFLNVRAERATQFPQPQETPELRLNFVKISPRAAKWRVAIIELAPSVVAAAVVAIIANGVLDITPALTQMRTGTLDDVSTGFGMLTSKPDFWLWTYIMFTVANTMTPRTSAGRILLRPMLIVIAVIVALIFALGLQEDTLTSITGAIAQVLDILAAVFGVVVALNAVAIFILAIIENTIERITGDSATIDKKGNLVAKKRAEIIAERLAERQKAIKAREPEKAKVPGATEGIPSIYRLPLPLPDSADTSKRVLMPPPSPAGAVAAPRHIEPDVIEGTAVIKTAPVDDDIDDDEAEELDVAPKPVVQPKTLTPSIPPPPAPRSPSPSGQPPRPATPSVPTRAAPLDELDDDDDEIDDADDADADEYTLPPLKQPPPRAPYTPPSPRATNELDQMSSAFGSFSDDDDDDDDVDDIEPV